MKVLDLRCDRGHGFEGWFGSEDDFASQHGRGLVECPLCGSQSVSRLPSAPRLNLSNAREPVAQQPKSGEPVAATPEAQQLQALWMQAVRHVMANTEDVGERFADEARRIHYGDAPSRGIRGQASPDQAAELVEEGIDVMPLPIPKVLKEPIQ
ncbi:DUF1178 family protein [Azohydromonas caseinilytica]|uniref:DUF1178 family protein n=1 Tax=Azohydromonas caseinilytica TaxID=2728836 RepID=A0A848F7A0_9BURK|nr:DUF1178 family protein [Azohydromonas caseinilytica]NML14595.1 DUF1178 family protein [Azohydromonas caseinilytica]